jgi:alpha-beta hydrolase superfamily lysophospholipase
MPAAPGVLLRQEAFDRKLPAGARAWRIVYTTTDTHGVATHASAIVMLSREVPAGPRPVVAWTHGTTGAVPGCGPSLLDDPFANVPALGPLLQRGWVYVATDYAGQATPGPHPYLIGEGQARSALDAVRAARQMKEVRLGDRTVVWGHSQGGHAALWTGILAPTYAPDVPLAGVAAAAPASDLRPLIEGGQHTPVGRIMGAFVLRAYSEVYPDVSWPAYVGHPVTRAVAFDMSGRCLAGRAALFSVAQALALGGTIFSTSPVHGALGARLQQNTPERLLTQALFVAQGDSDDLVRPEVQTRWVARRCAAGQALEYRRYAGRDHLSLVAPDSPYIDDLARWTDERFGGKPAPNGCASMPRSATP